MTVRSGQEPITLLGVGDTGGDWYRLPDPAAISQHIAPVFREADIAFAHLETTFTEETGAVSDVAQEFHQQEPAEFWNIIKDSGFDVVSVASNHGFNFGGDKFIANIENGRRLGILTSGGGKNINDAREPAIIERKGVSVAFLSYLSITHEALHDIAGNRQAGMAPMRAHTYYEPKGWQPGFPTVNVVTKTYENDLAACIEDIRKAKERADVVVLSFHWGVQDVRSLLADYQIEVAHASIDAGADLILGHHPHILKGVEMYKGKACFYSLNHFMHVGARARIFQGHRLGTTTKLADPGPEWEYYTYVPEARMTAVVKCQITKEGIQRVSYLPTAINGMAQPRMLPAGDPLFEPTVQYIREISADYFKTGFRVEGDEVVVT